MVDFVGSRGVSREIVVKKKNSRERDNLNADGQRDAGIDATTGLADVSANGKAATCRRSPKKQESGGHRPPLHCLHA